MQGRIGASLENPYFAFTAGSTSAAGGVDMNTCSHGRLEKILFVIDPYASFGRMKGDAMFGHVPRSQTLRKN
jgi:hypothetical protein